MKIMKGMEIMKYFRFGYFGTLALAFILMLLSGIQMYGVIFGLWKPIIIDQSTLDCFFAPLLVVLVVINQICAYPVIFSEE